MPFVINKILKQKKKNRITKHTFNGAAAAAKEGWPTCKRRLPQDGKNLNEWL